MQTFLCGALDELSTQRFHGTTCVGRLPLLFSHKHCIMGAEYSPLISAHVIRAALTMQQDWIVEKKKLGKKARAGPNIRETVCCLFGVGSATNQNSVASARNEKKSAKSRLFRSPSIYWTKTLCLRQKINMGRMKRRPWTPLLGLFDDS